MLHDAEVPLCDILQQAFLKLLRIFHQIPDQSQDRQLLVISPIHLGEGAVSYTHLTLPTTNEV